MEKQSSIVTSRVTLSKDLYNNLIITKENKSQWETASRKLRAVVPVLFKLNNIETRRHLSRKESKKSLKGRPSKTTNFDYDD